MFLKKLGMEILHLSLFRLVHQWVGRWDSDYATFFLPLFSCVLEQKLSNISYQVDKQHADFFRVTISEEQAKSGVVVRVTSTEQSKFKVCSDRNALLLLTYKLFSPMTIFEIFLFSVTLFWARFKWRLWISLTGTKEYSLSIKRVLFVASWVLYLSL